jgi:putative ABC transport system ATP-binding protein
METENGTAQVVVQLDDVRKTYDANPALDGVSLQIRRGEAVAVMGPSGCGKSTLLNMVAGLDRPTSGSVVVHGEDLGQLDEKGLALFRRRRIGIIFQFFNLLDDLSALDNVALAAQLTGTAAAQARRRALELLGELGIAARKDAYPGVLSGGRAAAGRGGQGADEPPGGAAGRRADRGAGQLQRRAGDGPADRPEPDRADPGGPASTMPARASVTCDAVDPLPDEVGVAVVARILLYHVQVDPADVPGAFRVVPVAGHDVIKLLSGHGSTGVLYFLLEGLDAGGRVRVIERFEVLACLVRVIGEGHVAVRRVHATIKLRPEDAARIPDGEFQGLVRAALRA